MAWRRRACESTKVVLLAESPVFGFDFDQRKRARRTASARRIWKSSAIAMNESWSCHWKFSQKAAMCVAASASGKRHGSHSLKRRKNTRWNRGRSLSCVRIAAPPKELRRARWPVALLSRAAAVTTDAKSPCMLPAAGGGVGAAGSAFIDPSDCSPFQVKAAADFCRCGPLRLRSAAARGVERPEREEALRKNSMGRPSCARR